MSELSNSVLPDDIVADILVRLPVKPIGRFRCVSKPWRSLLSNHKFLRNHHEHNLLKPTGNLITLSSPYCYFPYILNLANAESSTAMNNVVAKSLPSELQNCKVLGSCDGFLLLENSGGFTLINPITLETLQILDDRDDVYGPECFYGIGYDSSSDDYKIVSLMQFSDDYDGDYDDDDDESIVDIYSIRMKSWKRIGKAPYILRPHDAFNSFYVTGGYYIDPVGVFLNGCIHWFCSNKELVCFNLAREEFVEGLYPYSIGKELVYPYEWFGYGIKVFNGCLGVVSFSEHTARLWVMREYGVQDSWMKFATLYHLDENNFIQDVFCELNEDEIVVEMANSHYKLKLVAYNWRNGISRDLVIDGLPPDSDLIVMPFKGSLLSPNFYVN